MFRATTPVRTKIPVPTIAPIPSIVKSSAPNVLANVFAYFHALTLQLASLKNLLHLSLLQVLNFLKIFNSLFILLITLFLVNTFVETSRNSSEYAPSLLFFLYIFPLFFDIIIHVDSVKRHVPLLSMPFYLFHSI